MDNWTVIKFILFLPIIMWPLTLIYIIIIALIIIEKKQEKNRKTILINFSKSKNLQYSNKFSVLPLATKKDFLFNPDYKTIIGLNILYGEAENINFFIVDQKYKYSKESKIVTACILRKPFLDLPRFSLYKRIPNYSDILKHFNLEDKEIIIDPVFSKKFRLNGEESKIISFFNERIKNLFIKRYIPNYEYAGYQDCFIVYVNKRLSPYELIKFQSYSFNLFKELVNN